MIILPHNGNICWFFIFYWRQPTLDPMVKGIINLSILISSPTTNDKMATKASVAWPAHTAQ